MKRITLTFMILLSVFFTIWGVKMKHPINRPENVKEDTETPWYETKYQAPKADDEWTLDPEIPLNYIPVPGEDELYMVVDDSGNITNYRKRVKQADGSWVWQDVNPDIPDNYEKVDGLDNVYKVTNKDGTTEYKQYVRKKYYFISPFQCVNLLRPAPDKQRNNLIRFNFSILLSVKFHLLFTFHNKKNSYLILNILYHLVVHLSNLWTK